MANSDISKGGLETARQMNAGVKNRVGENDKFINDARPAKEVKVAEEKGTND